MTQERLEKILENAMWQKCEAEKILAGEKDNYDGADGARYVRQLCCCIEELIEALEKK